jgi:hypothetical protein
MMCVGFSTNVFMHMERMELRQYQFGAVPITCNLAALYASLIYGY